MKICNDWCEGWWDLPPVSGDICLHLIPLTINSISARWSSQCKVNILQIIGIYANVKFLNIGQHRQKIKTKCVQLVPHQNTGEHEVQNKNRKQKQYYIDWRVECLSVSYWLVTPKVSLKWPSKLTSIRKEFSLITTTKITIGSIQLLFFQQPSEPTAHISRMINTHVTQFSHLSLHKGYL